MARVDFGVTFQGLRFDRGFISINPQVQFTKTSPGLWILNNLVRARMLTFKLNETCNMITAYVQC